MSALDRRPSTLSFPERYAELHDDMRLPIWQVCQKLKLTPSSLHRMLLREKMPVPAELYPLLSEATI